MRIAIDVRVLDGPSSFRGIGVYTRSITHEILPELLNAGHSVDLLVYDKADIDYLSPTVRGACSVVMVPKKLGWITKRLRAKLASIVEHLDYLPRKTVSKIAEVDQFFQIANDYGIPYFKSNTKTMIVAYDLAPLKIPEGFFNPKVSANPGSWFKFIYKKRQQRVYKRRLRHFKSADTVFAISKFTKSTLKKELGLDESKLVITPLATPQLPHPNSDPKHYKTRPYLFFVGGLDGRRDIDSLLAAMRIIIKDKPKMQLLLAGKDFDYADRIVPDDLKDNLRLLGYITEQEKADYLAAALAFVYPTLYEGFGLPLLEAFAMDCPVITYKNSSLPEVGGKAAIYVKNSKQIADAALKLMQAGNRNKAIIAGRKQVAKFSWDVTAEKTLSVLGSKQ